MCSQLVETKRYVTVSIVCYICFDQYTSAYICLIGQAMLKYVNMLADICQQAEKMKTF